jgi:hypothetical protein
MSKKDKMQIVQFLMDENNDIVKDLQKEHSYAAIISILTPMAFDNIITEHPCEFVSVVLSKGTKLGFYMEATDSMLLLDPVIDDFRLDIIILLPRKDTMQKTSIELPIYWTGNVWSDCSMLLSVLRSKKEFLTNLIMLIDYDSDSCIEN